MIKNRNLTSIQKLKFTSSHLLEHFTTLKKNEKKVIQESNEVAHKLKKYGEAKSLQIERVRGLSDREIKENYFKKHIPVIIEDKAQNFSCMDKWSPSFLKDQYGDHIVPIVNPDIKTLENVEHSETTLREIIECFENGDDTKYARFNNLFYAYPELMEDFDKDWYKSMKLKSGVGSLFNIFIGAAKTKTTLHSACSLNLFTQVYGEKKWTIIPPEYDSIVNPRVTRTQFFVTELDTDEPDLEKFPAYPFIQKYECILKPGDTLYMPACWWHQVTNLSNSIGYSYRWFDPIDSFYQSATQTLCFLTSTNPPLWDYLTKSKDFSSKIIRKVK